jgi:hypothetical protein
VSIMADPRSATPTDAPIQLDLRRLPHQRSDYQLGNVGIVRRSKMGWRAAHLQAGDWQWTVAVSGVWKPRVHAIDPAGTVVGEYLPRAFRGGGMVRWYDQELPLRPISSWRQRYALTNHGRDIVTVDARTGGRRPVSMTVLHPGLTDPGLLLFTAVAAVWIASDTAGTAAAVGVTASSAAWTG